MSNERTPTMSRLFLAMLFAAMANGALIALGAVTWNWIARSVGADPITAWQALTIWCALASVDLLARRSMRNAP